ncbi:hypothetical protein [Flavobacterium sp.]|uniref:hypothetical protein n=1 Tax=Flavobacterium sp. TaxID=239 RepID=UPI002B4AF5C7|nr:hypothetical protein [Flavobacterium sp.]HLF52461.1 hypothetical protein [Flavobacterium sp.]
MKKLVFLFMLIFTISSCSVDGEPQSEFVVLPVESVIMPSTYAVDSISEITVKYTRPTDCYIFNGFYYDINANTRTVAINAVKLDQNNCQDDSGNLFEVPLSFKPTTDGIYVFKFWTGTDTSGVDQYLTYEIEVLP